MAQQIDVDFRQHAHASAQEGTQGVLFRRFQPDGEPARPARFVAPELDRCLSAAGLQRSAYAIARAILLHMRPDTDGVWFAWPSRARILQVAGVSLATWKRYHRHVLSALGLEVMPRGPHSRVYVFRGYQTPCCKSAGRDRRQGAAQGDPAGAQSASGIGGRRPLQAVREPAADTDIETLASQLLGRPGLGAILSAAGAADAPCLARRLTRCCASSPRMRACLLAEPWAYVAHVEARAGHEHALEYGLVGLAGISRTARPDPARVSELRALWQLDRQETAG